MLFRSVSETDAISFGVGAEETTIHLDPASSPPRLLNFQSQFGSNYTSFPLSFGAVRDTRDSAIWTTNGSVIRGNLEVSVVGDLNYYRIASEYNHYTPLTRDLTMYFRGEVSAADGLGGKPLPFFKNFYAGGIGTVRGYRTAGLGARDPYDNSAIGGNKRMSGSAEILFPFPGTELDRSMRLSTFVDAGQVFQASEKIAFTDLRYSYGISFSWISPVGPLKLSYEIGRAHV